MNLGSCLDALARRDWASVDSGTVRFAVVGLGWWTRERAIPAVAASDLGEVTVLVSASPLNSTATGWPGTVERALTYDEFHDGVGVESYDAAYVATPNALHLPHVAAAARHGKHVLCEKPMEATVERAEEMVEVVDEAGVTLMVGYRMQTEPLVRRAREFVRDGVVGTPAHVNAHMSQRLLEMNPDHGQWRLDPALAGPGTSVTDLGIYPLNTTRFLLDDDPASVTATTRSASPGFERVPDERASFEVAFEGGVLASCWASQNARRSGRFEVIGREGRLAIQPAFFGDDRRSLVVERGDATAEYAAEPVDQMTEEFDYFSDRVLADEPVAPDGEHGLVDVRTIAAIYEAAASGTRVPL